MENKIEKYKFFGKFLDVKSSEFHEDNFTNVLISTKVYIEEEVQSDNKTRFKQNFYNYKEGFYLSEKYYELNPLIIEEIFNYYSMLMTIHSIKSNAYYRNSINTRIESINDNYSKLKLLIKNRNKLINKSIKYVYKLNDFVSVFNEENQKKEGFNKVFYNFITNEEIENFLTLRILEFEGEFLTEWKKYNLQNIQISCYNEIIENTELLINSELKPKIESNPLSKIIFNDDGEKIFTFFVMKYPKSKNTAFFSYLFYYLKDNLNKLLIFGNDSIDYRNYIKELYGISFSRIQTTTSSNQYKKTEIFNLFDKYIEEYYSLKNEDNLSNNE